MYLSLLRRCISGTPYPAFINVRNTSTLCIFVEGVSERGGGSVDCQIDTAF